MASDTSIHWKSKKNHKNHVRFHHLLWSQATRIQKIGEKIIIKYDFLSFSCSCILGIQWKCKKNHNFNSIFNFLGWPWVNIMKHRLPCAGHARRKVRKDIQTLARRKGLHKATLEQNPYAALRGSSSVREVSCAGLVPEFFWYDLFL